MASPAKADAAGKGQEPSMEEILASIRKIISDDDSKSAKPAAKAPDPVPEPEVAPAGQDDIDALMASLDEVPEPPPPPKAAAKPVPKPQPPPQPDVLELTEDMTSAIDFVDPSDEVAPPPVVAVPAPVRPRVEPRAALPDFEPAPMPAPAPAAPDRLLSAGADQAIAQAFGSLTHTILAQNARTLDDLVQDMLRPMLKQWLDDNLPSLVERLVRAEIERVSRGR